MAREIIEVILDIVKPYEYKVGNTKYNILVRLNYKYYFAWSCAVSIYIEWNNINARQYHENHLQT